MAPYFLRNLIPQREQRESARPLLTVLAGLTWVQWAHFFSGYVPKPFLVMPPRNRPAKSSRTGFLLAIQASGFEVELIDHFMQVVGLDLRRDRFLLGVAQHLTLGG